MGGETVNSKTGESVYHSESTVGEKNCSCVSLDDLVRLCILQLDTLVKGL